LLLTPESPFQGGGAQGQLPGRWHLLAAALSPFQSGYHCFVRGTNAAVAVLSVVWGRPGALYRLRVTFLFV